MQYTLVGVALCLFYLTLLLGTVGLFIALGVVMYATRNVDWYGQGRKR